jgi:hypothetical protein
LKRALACVALAANATACALFLPESQNRMELASREQRETCGKTEIDPRVIGPEAIERVEPLYSTVPSRSGHDVHFLGAKLRVVPMPGMTSELLERTLRCHGAQETLAATPATPGSPYWLPNGWVKIRVESDDGAFSVKLSSHERRSADEILARARAYVGSAKSSSR